MALTDILNGGTLDEVVVTARRTPNTVPGITSFDMQKLRDETSEQMKEFQRTLNTEPKDIDSSDPLSYETILADRLRFRQAGGPNSSDFNIYDTPSNTYFRLLFHFFDSIDSGIDQGAGLLHPTWFDVNGAWVSQKNQSRADELDYWKHSTAWSYLMMNDEQDRAKYLRKFIELLSSINSQSPWYFQKLKGLDEALNRKQITEDFMFKDRYRISLECLPDSVDQRLGTLLDLYRASVWSWRMKREIVPANLRKFDMSIVIFQAPIQALHTPVHQPKISDVLGRASKWVSQDDPDYATINPKNLGKHVSKNTYIGSFKVFELHNCEFDINSSKSVYSEMDNKEGTIDPTYTINIDFDDILERRYNEFMEHDSHYFGDMVDVDLTEPIYNQNSGIKEKFEKNDIANIYEPDTKDPPLDDSKQTQSSIDTESQLPGARLSRRTDRSTTNQLLGGLIGKVSNKVNSLVLGNMFGFSLDRLGRNVDQFLEGNVWNTIGNVQKTINGNFSGKRTLKEPLENINADSYQAPPQTKILGNIFKSRSIINSMTR